MENDKRQIHDEPSSLRELTLEAQHGNTAKPAESDKASLTPRGLAPHKEKDLQPKGLDQSMSEPHQLFTEERMQSPTQKNPLQLSNGGACQSCLAKTAKAVCLCSTDPTATSGNPRQIGPPSLLPHKTSMHEPQVLEMQLLEMQLLDRKPLEMHQLIGRDKSEQHCLNNAQLIPRLTQPGS